jgi:MFS family permease
MGLFGAAFGAGFVVGPAIGAGLIALGRYVVGDSGTSWPGFGAAAISLVAFWLVLTRLPESVAPGQSHAATERSFSFARLAAALHRPRLAELLSLYFVLTFAFVFLEVTFVLLCMDELGISEASTMGLFACLGMLMVMVQGGLVGRLAPRLGEPTLLSIGPMFTAVGFVLIALAPQTDGYVPPWLYMLIACVPLTLGNGLTNPSLMSLVSRQSDSERQGATLGLAQGLASLARATAPLLGGWLFDVRPSIPYWTGAGAFALCTVVALLIRQKQVANLEGNKKVSGWCAGESR